MKENTKTGYVKTNMGLIPIEDYREIIANGCGYDNYNEMKEDMPEWAVNTIMKGELI